MHKYLHLHPHPITSYEDGVCKPPVEIDQDDCIPTLIDCIEKWISFASLYHSLKSFLVEACHAKHFPKIVFGIHLFACHNELDASLEYTSFSISSNYTIIIYHLLNPLPALVCFISMASSHAYLIEPASSGHFNKTKLPFTRPFVRTQLLLGRP